MKVQVYWQSVDLYNMLMGTPPKKKKKIMIILADLVYIHSIIIIIIQKRYKVFCICLQRYISQQLLKHNILH